MSPKSWITIHIDVGEEGRMHHAREHVTVRNTIVVALGAEREATGHLERARRNTYVFRILQAPRCCSSWATKKKPKERRGACL